MLLKLNVKIFPKTKQISLIRQFGVEALKEKNEEYSLFHNRIQSWQIHSYGDLTEIQKSNARSPFLKSSTQLLVKVNAVSLNPMDLMMVSGYARTVGSFFRQNEFELPLTLGRDFCGTVVNKGQEVEDFKIGDDVYGVIPFHKQGSLSEVILADQSLVCSKPDHLTALEAASLPYAGMTAWSALNFSGGLGSIIPNQTKFLILGASGGIGTLAIQMLKAKSAIVVGTCSSNAISLVESLGAAAAYDYTDLHFNDNIMNSGPYDVILDCAKIGPANIPKEWAYKSYISLNPPLVTNTDNYGLLGGLALSASNLFTENITKCSEGKTIKWGFFAPLPSGLQFIDGLVRKKQIKPVIHEIFKFDEVFQAFETLSKGHLRGKIVVDFK